MRRRIGYWLLPIGLIAASGAGAQEPRTYESHAAVLGHPIHPMLIVFPIALLLTGLLFDIIYLARKDIFWHRAATWALLLGFIGGLAAAVPGLIDYLRAIPEGAEPHENAETHGLLNLGVLVVFGLNLILRWKRDTSVGGALRWTLALSVIGAALLLVSGWYGGHMVYREGVGIDLEEEEPESSSSQMPNFPPDSASRTWDVCINMARIK